jgi:hypothetical protein
MSRTTWKGLRPVRETSDIDVRGDAPVQVAIEARVRVAHALDRFGVQVAQLRVRLSDAAGQLSGRVLAQANAIAAGQRVRVQVTGATYGQAVERLAARLRARIGETVGTWMPRAWPDPTDESRVLGDGGHIVPRGGGWVVRVKPCELIRYEVPAAAWVMDAMDYGAHLFADSETGLDAVIYRAGPTGYRLRRLRAAAPPRPSIVPLAMDPRPAPLLNRDQAVASLDRTGLAHLFFQDAASGRGSLLYRRFDGHYALIAGAA